jgi:hypothetical protein
MSDHRCTFDSAVGIVPGRNDLALRCLCGRWGMPADGEWRGVPNELLPSACAHFDKVQRMHGWAYMAVVGVVVGLFLWLA